MTSVCNTKAFTGAAVELDDSLARVGARPAVASVSASRLSDGYTAASTFSFTTAANVGPAGPVGPGHLTNAAAFTSQISTLKTNVDAAFDKLQSVIETKVYAEKLPLLGPQLQQVYGQLDKINSMRSAIDGVLDTFAAAGSANQTNAYFQQLISQYFDQNTALGHLLNGAFTAGANTFSLNFGYAATSTSAVSLASDLGLGGFGFETGGSLNATGSMSFALGLNLDASGAISLAHQTEAALGFTLTAPAVAADVTLGFLDFSVVDQGSQVAGVFTLDLDDALNGVSASLTGGADINLHLSGQADLPGVPRIDADLGVDWNFAGTVVGGDVAQLGSAAPTVTFNHVSYDIGDFLTDFIKPIIDNLKPLMEPLQQALAVFNTELDFLDIVPGLVPLLDKAGGGDGGPDGHLTLLDFAKFAKPSLDTASITAVANTVQDVIHWAEVLGQITDGSLGAEQYDLGSLQIVQDLRQGAGFLQQLHDTTVSAGGVTGTASLSDFLGGLSGVWTNGGADSAKAILEELVLGQLYGGAMPGPSAANSGSAGAPVFQFPVITDPTKVFGLLFGQTVDLFKLDLPELSFGIGAIADDGTPTSLQDLITVPILPGVDISFAAAFQVAFNLAFGYDTHGLSQFKTSGDALDLLNGFYINDLHGGVDKPEITIAAALEMAIHASILGAGVSGAGNISGQLFLDLSDALADSQGRVHLDDMAGALTTDPFSIFDVSGRITAGLSAYVTAPLIGAVWRYNSPRITLADFSSGHVTLGQDQAPNVPLADLSGGVLNLHVGPTAGLRTGVPQHTDTGEELHVGLGPGGKLIVAGFNHTDLYDPASGMAASAGQGGDTLEVDDDVTASATFDGGAGDDFLYGGGGGDSLSGGDDRDYIEGGLGADALSGDAGDDVLDGGAAGDTINGGAGGFDIVTYQGSKSAVNINLASGVLAGGDAAGDVLVDIEAIEGSNSDTLKDTLTGGGGADIFFGLKGRDKLSGGDGGDILVGGAGADTMDGGAGADSASYVAATAGVTVGPTGGSTGEAQGDVLSNIEQIEGSQYADHLTAGGTVWALLGQLGDDTLDGGSGDDRLEGGAGADKLNGAAGADTASYRFAGAAVTVDLTAHAGSAGDAQGDTYKLIEGVDGSDFGDTIKGDGGGNTLYGWAGADTVDAAAGADYVSGGAGLDSLAGGDGDDTLVGGADGDSLAGGLGIDTAAYRSSLAAIVIDMTGLAGTGDAAGDSFSSIEIVEGSDLSGVGDLMIGDAQAETLRGLKGDDTLRGGAGGDRLEGGLGADALRGEAGADTLTGAAGPDRFDGGDDRDLLSYAAAAAAVTLNLGVQIRYNGVTYAGGKAAQDGDGSSDTVTGVEDAVGSGAADLMFGASGGSSLSGGLGLDTLVGRDGSDTLNGGAGADVLDGGAGGQDYAGYIDDGARVTVDLNARTATDGGGAVDSLVNMEGALGGAYDDLLLGRDKGGTDSGKDWLVGGAGNDTLDGRSGDDDLEGGQGDDTYKVDSLGDTVRETGASTADRIVTAVDYTITLASNVEQLELAGGARIGTGNALANLMLGTAGDDTLNGLGGADDMRGGAGADVYLFDQFGDRVVEAAGAGTDEIRLSTVNAPISPSTPVPTFSLNASWAANVEDLVLTDDAHAVHLTGNGLANRLVGNGLDQLLQGLSGDDTLNGRTGRDTATGGAGFDTLAIDWSGESLAYRNDPLAADAGGGYAGTFYRADNGNYNYRVDFAGIERFSVTTGSGSDAIWTGDAADTVSGGLGYDVLNTGKGADIVDGGGNDPDGVGVSAPDIWIADKSAAASAMTINLNAASSTYQIGAATGAVRGVEQLGRSDTGEAFSSGGGDDVLTTQAGFFHDFVSTGLGSDTVKIAGGRDRVDMGGQSTAGDLLVIDWSGEVLSYRTGDFTLAADGYASVIYRADNGNYNNRIDFTGAERFSIATGSGDDDIRTGDNNDSITGGAGADIVRAGKGADTIDGGANDDGRADVLCGDKSAATEAMTINLNKAAASTYRIGLVTGSVKGVEALGLDTSDNRFSTGAGDDVVTTQGGFFSDFLATNGGADTVKLSGGRDWVDLGVQTGAGDTLVVDWSLETLSYRIDALALTAGYGYAGVLYRSDNGNYNNRVDFFGVERFSLTMGAGDDDVRGGDNADTISTGAGNDLIRSGGGADIVDGGDNSRTDGISTAPDIWVADKSAATAAMVIDLTAASSSYVVDGATGTVRSIEQLGVVQAGDDFRTGSGDDTVTTLGGFFSDYLNTGGGADTVRIAGGRDLVDMGDGAGAGDLLIVDWTSNANGYAYRSGPLTLNADGYAGVLSRSDNGNYNNRVDFTGVERFRISTADQGDWIVAGDHADTVSGGAGADTITSGRGADIIDGGADGADGGPDVWVADKGDATTNTTIDLTAAASTYLIGGVAGSVTGIEQLGRADAGAAFRTGSGDDVVKTLGGFFSDFVQTGAGDDTVTLRGGRDQVDMGAHGAAGDLLIVDWTGETYGYAMSAANLQADGYAGVISRSDNGNYNDRVDFTGVERFSLTTGAGADSLITGDFADTISTGDGIDTIRSGKGADVVDGGAGTGDIWIADKSSATAALSIDLSAVRSTYRIGAATGSVSGVEQLGSADGGEAFAAGGGDDLVKTGAGAFNDFVQTGNGTDTVWILGGRDRVSMGGASEVGDLLVVDWSAATLSFSSSFSGSGADYAGVYARSDNGNYDNRIDFDGVERFQVTMGAGADTVMSGSFADTIGGGAGDDVLITGAGSDVVDGGDGLDWWQADAHAAKAFQPITIDLASGAPSAYLGGSVANVERISLTTGAGADSIVTGRSFLDDVVSTGAGDDVVTVAGGRDSIAMGFDTKKGDLLRLDWTGSADAHATTLASGQTGWSGSFYRADNGAYGDRADFSGVDRFDLLFGAAADSIVTGSGSDTLNGGDGADTLDAGDGKDRVLGGDGDDHLYGGDGVDVLTGGAGRDTLEGGGGGDRFVFTDAGESAVANEDLIVRLDLNDRIDLSQVDANTLRDGDQKFTLAIAFHAKAGELVLTYNKTTNRTLIQGDVDGDGDADLSIAVAGDAHRFEAFVY